MHINHGVRKSSQGPVQIGRIRHLHQAFYLFKQYGRDGNSNQILNNSRSLSNTPAHVQAMLQHLQGLISLFVGNLEAYLQLHREDHTAKGRKVRQLQGKAVL